MLFLGKTPDALRLLDRSEELYKKENNLIAAASAKLVRAQILLKGNNTEAAETEARDALATCERGGNLRFALFARWLLGEISRENGDVEAAMRYLKTALARAGGESNQIEYLCLVSLGKTTGDEIYFRKAVDLIENSRSTLVSPELRTAFFSEKIIPYNELVKLELVRGNVDDALRWHERSRSRTLLEGMERLSADTQPNDKLLKIREELDWYYSRIHRQTATGLEARSANASLRKLALKSEKKYAELLRRSQVNGNFAGGQAVDVDIARFQSHLAETTVVEFMIFDQSISAFIITSNGLHALPHYVNEGLVNLEIRQLLFQIKTSRFQDRLSPDNRKLANERLLRHCEKLYDLLIRPIESLFNGERLVFMPAGILHYLPFQSLNDGLGFMIERFEISYAPSIIALQTCLSAPSRGRQNAVFAGVADERAPLVEDEIATISGLFDHSTCLLNADATHHNLSLNLPDADVVHLACHGNFRPDNPAFSSLSLYDENLTVNEVRNMRLTGRMIVLSACESGLNDVVKGEELVGLTRAFFEAGASTLVQSLWNVSDRSTLELMKIFYREFIRGSDPAAALRVAQRALIDAESSPYLWAPFIVSGRW